MAFSHLKWFEFATTSINTPFLHLCSFVYLVFHFRHTPRSREQSWKATVWSNFSVYEPESLRQLAAVADYFCIHVLCMHIFAEVNSRTYKESFSICNNYTLTSNYTASKYIHLTIRGSYIDLWLLSLVYKSEDIHRQCRNSEKKRSPMYELTDSWDLQRMA